MLKMSAGGKRSSLLWESFNDEEKVYFSDIFVEIVKGTTRLIMMEVISTLNLYDRRHNDNQHKA
jgi:hypothetical protein